MKKPMPAAARGPSQLVSTLFQGHSRLMFAPVAFAMSCVIAMAAGSAAAAQRAQTEQAIADFDTETLKARGIDPKLAEYFREAPRFTQGMHVVSLMVNGVNVGKADASFDSQGQLCFDSKLLAKARLRTPDEKHVLSGENGAGRHCYDFAAAYPQTEVALRPNREEVAIVVPQDALIVDSSQSADFARGGFAAIANYDVTGIRASSDANSQDHLSATTQFGFNMGDWIVRSHQTFSKDDDRSRFDHLYTYAQRTFVDQKAVLQAGQININSPLFAGASITGVQILPERALAKTAQSGALVEGIAPSQATVEVRQAGMLILRTMVPEGPFVLTDFPLLNTTSDLNVTVRETNGAERHFTVSAASFRTSALATPGYGLAFGKVRAVGNAGIDQPWVATAAGTWELFRGAAATAAGMVSSRYQAIGLGGDASIANDVSVSVRNVFSNQLDGGFKGAQLSAALAVPLPQGITGSLSATQQTLGYRDFSDTLIRSDGNGYRERFKSQHTASLGWTNETIGSVNVSYSAHKTFNGRQDNRLVASWGWKFKRATITASVETSLGRRRSGGGNAQAAYLSVNIPLGRNSLQAYTRQRGGEVRTGVAISDVVNDQLNYRLAAERDSTSGSTYASANVSVLPRYTAIDLGYSQSNSSRAYSGRISGGVVAHRSGVTFSPYPVQDTFGIAKVPNVSGVKLVTPQGPVWTDFTGQAVVPALNAYRHSRIEVQTKSLPRRIDLRNGFKEVDAGRGSVNVISFDVIKARRYLVSAVDEQGLRLPKGALVLDAASNYLTTVLESGEVFLSDTGPEAALQVVLPDGGSCDLNIDFPKEVNDDAFYDTASAICRR